jgi:hypothetical protein
MADLRICKQRATRDLLSSIPEVVYGNIYLKKKTRNYI